MSDRARNPLKGRNTIPGGITDVPNDFEVVHLGGIIVGDPTTPEDVGTEAITSQAPAAPGTPTVTTGTATDHVFVNATWAAASNQAVPAKQYEVYVNVAGQNPTVFRVEGSITAIRIAPAKPSTTYQVKVRAISRLEVAGSYSAYGSVTSAAAVLPVITFAPATPAAPTVTAAVYTLLVSWTALADITSGYGLYDVQIATDSGFTLNVRTRTIDGTITSFTDLTPGTTYYARVRGIGRDGVAGAWSTSSNAATTKIVAGDITALTITAAQIAADTITASQIAADAITASELAAVNLAVGKYIRSTTYTPGLVGWAIDAAGNAEFGNLNARGNIQAGGGDNLLTDGDGELDTNLAVNGLLEVNATGWTADANTTIARSLTLGGAQGTAALRLTATAAVPNFGATSTSFITGLVAGQIYVATAWFQTAVTARTMRLSINWYDAAHAFISTTTGLSPTDTAGTWWLATIKATAPAGAVECKIQLHSTATPAAAELHYVDAVYFSRDLGSVASSGWSRPGTGRLAKSLASMKTGTACLAFICDGGGTDYLSSDYFAVVPGQSYSSEFSYKFGPSTGTPTAPTLITIFWYTDLAGTACTTVSTALTTPTTPTTTWYTGRAAAASDAAVGTSVDVNGALVNGPYDFATAPFDAVYARVRYSFTAAANNDAYLLDQLAIKKFSFIEGALMPQGKIYGVAAKMSALANTNTPTTNASYGTWDVAIPLSLTRGRKYILMAWFQGQWTSLVAGTHSANIRIQYSLDAAGTVYSDIVVGPTQTVGSLAGAALVVPMSTCGMVYVEDNIAGVTDPGGSTWNLRVRVQGRKSTGTADAFAMQNGNLMLFVQPV